MKPQYAAAVLAVAFCWTPAKIRGESLTLDCDAGGSITRALADLKAGDILVVSGTCTESVVIPPEAVGITITGQGKATIRHPTGGAAVGSAAHVIYVRGRAITITGFTLTGGNDGIHLSGPAHAVIEGNVIAHNRGRGVHLDKGSVAQIANNTIEDNASHGINIAEQSHARIGFLIPPDEQLAPNTIRGNGGDGVHLERGATAWIVGNTIVGNAGNGVAVDRNSQADVVGNSISRNHGDGILATHNSGVNLMSERTPRREGPNQTEPNAKNAGAGIRCSIGGYVAGPAGSLTGNRGSKIIDAMCVDRIDR
jgi:parallel beta-helix repeat protein